MATGQARKVIPCHGIYNMPLEGIRRMGWERALFGADQGVRTRMAYWVDRATRQPESEAFVASLTKQLEAAGRAAPTC